MKYEKAEEYIRKLNQNKFAGHDDWRLPTIPELMSLLEQEKKDSDLYLGPVFDNKQYWCWSSDKTPSDWWIVDFNYGDVHFKRNDASLYVRGVRSR